ncbi:TPA: helix-turn-helix transcriptional regulator [Clostridioides difficile]|uniref:helix-turn-helix transcriptional regulator n=1 Tax=unclassified Clostridioides TaxID=2635829 RepID=UPI0018C2DC08|nr:XRE family transcriptional regulator [Clostridioides difficile]MCC0641606.1 helix-turn-helix transcriptional regulator [Clostridioides sp. ES-S-0049-03]MCC0677320.1 helix-turn-helix transcriptional regulator [Clostridioides sp. ES-W-0018-02]MCC0712469.1 helix-turn-helix transcriptional regulator [Clostridioides sp. ES-W-0017-02]EGT4836508.1 XRE family transcriptional regulator [Clostridioides difficile]
MDKRLNLISVRKKMGLTQADVAKYLGINRSYYGFIENGIRNPNLDIANNIAKLFNLELKEAFPEEIFFANKCYKMKL